MLTGLDPDRHGIRHNSVFTLDPGLPTLPERLRAEGFATAAFVGAFVLDARFGLARGFDVYDDDLAGERRSGMVGFAERRAAEVVDAWREGRPAKVMLAGHADRAGSESYNMALSERRAQTVAAALVARGVPADALDVKWFGESQPRVPTPDGQREPQNRRVEITVQ